MILKTQVRISNRSTEGTKVVCKLNSSTQKVCMIVSIMPNKKQQLTLIFTEKKLNQLDIKNLTSQRVCPTYLQQCKTKRYLKVISLILEVCCKPLLWTKQAQITLASMLG